MKRAIILAAVAVKAALLTLAIGVSDEPVEATEGVEVAACCHDLPEC